MIHFAIDGQQYEIPYHNDRDQQLTAAQACFSKTETALGHPEGVFGRAIKFAAAFNWKRFQHTENRTLLQMLSNTITARIKAKREMQEVMN